MEPVIWGLVEGSRGVSPGEDRGDIITVFKCLKGSKCRIGPLSGNSKKNSVANRSINSGTVLSRELQITVGFYQEPLRRGAVEAI